MPRIEAVLNFLPPFSRLVFCEHEHMKIMEVCVVQHVSHIVAMYDVIIHERKSKEYQTR